MGPRRHFYPDQPPPAQSGLCRRFANFAQFHRLGALARFSSVCFCASLGAGLTSGDGCVDHSKGGRASSWRFKLPLGGSDPRLPPPDFQEPAKPPFQRMTSSCERSTLRRLVILCGLNQSGGAAAATVIRLLPRRPLTWLACRNPFQTESTGQPHRLPMIFTCQTMFFRHWMGTKAVEVWVNISQQERPLTWIVVDKADLRSAKAHSALSITASIAEGLLQ